MALWSLTKERVEKLRAQIGDKETEVDNLIKLSKEDLWRIDLDHFLEEWRFQLEDEKKLGKKIASRGRRVSTKLMTAGKGAAKKRRADEGDSDFDVPKPKKAATTKHVKPKGGLLDYLNKPVKSKPKSFVDGASDSDDLEEEIMPAKKPRAAAKRGAAKPKPLSSDSDDDFGVVEAPAPKPKQASVQSQSSKSVIPDAGDSDIEIKGDSPKELSAASSADKQSDKDSDIEMVDEPAPRQARSRKPVKYETLSSSESDNGDDLLGDVSSMVKGIREGNADPHSDSRTLFSEPARIGPGSATKPTTKAQRLAMEFDPDETDYSKLIPQNSPRRSLLVKPKETKASSDNEDDSKDAAKASTKGKAASTKASSVKAAKPAPKAAPKTKARPKKAAAPPPAAKPTPLSPAAKAYASKKAKASKMVISDDSDDDIDAMANDILDSEPEKEATPPPPKGRPTRRAAATSKKPAYVIEDDSDELASSDAGGGVSSDDFSDL